MRLTATEIRDWLDSAATWTGLYLTWRWRSRKDPAHGIGGGSLALTTGNDAGSQAVLDTMAEVFPYEFPPN